MAEDRANSNARVFPTLPGVYSEGVKVIPGGSQPTTPSTYKPPFDLWTAMGRTDQSKPPAKVNTSTGSSEKYLRGSDKYGDSIKPESRPKPNQGTKVFTPGVGTKTFGGSQPGAIPITGNPTPPKNPGRVSTFLNGLKGNLGKGGGGFGIGGGGGPFNKID
jgi:hypothetical protein